MSTVASANGPGDAPAMVLTVIARSTAGLSQGKNSLVLRLLGLPDPGEVSPPNLLSLADAAAAEVRREFPGWLWKWTETNGALGLETFPGLVSWWWLTPLSEKSPTRSPLIRELYWLTLLRHVLAATPVKRVVWLGGDAELAAVAAAVANEHGVEFEAKLIERGSRRGVAWRAARYCKHTLTHVARWLFLKVLSIDCGTLGGTDALLFTRFPVLWEQVMGTWRERMYGEWPEYLRGCGRRVAYVATLTGSPLQLFDRRLELRRICSAHNIRILDAALTFSDMVRIHLSSRRWWRYRTWRRSRQPQPVHYRGLDVSRLFWRQFDDEANHPGIASEHSIIIGLQRVLREAAPPQAVFFPFEYQPMERAIIAGVKSVANVPTVGLQTGLFTANQMGFALPAAELDATVHKTVRPPLPDYIAAYGELPHRVFSERLGAARVCLSGPVRYPRLGKTEAFDAGAFCRQHRLPEDARFILVTTSLTATESLPLLRGAFTIAMEEPEVFLLCKFHYHLPLHREVERLAANCGCVRFRIFEGELYQLMRLAPVLVSAGSSTTIEAIVWGAMPVIYRSPGEMSENPMLDVPDAGFFWHTVDELRAALRSCLMRDAAYQSRRAAWEHAIRAHLFRLDAAPNERLYRFLQQRNVF